MSSSAASPASSQQAPSRRLAAVAAAAALSLAMAALAWRLSPPGSALATATLGLIGLFATLGVAATADKARLPHCALAFAIGAFAVAAAALSRRRWRAAGAGLRPWRARPFRSDDLPRGARGPPSQARAGARRVRTYRCARGGPLPLQRLVCHCLARSDDRGFHVLPEALDRRRVADRLWALAFAAPRSRRFDEGGLFLGSRARARPRAGVDRAALARRLSGRDTRRSTPFPR